MKHFNNHRLTNKNKDLTYLYDKTATVNYTKCFQIFTI